MRLHSFRLNQRGLARMFGELEAKVMSAVWNSDQTTVHDVVRRLGPGTNYKTVMTVMNRLVEKGFLERRKVSRAFVYVPAISRDGLVERMSREVITGLIADFGPTVLNQLVEAVAAADRNRLVDLDRLVQSRLALQRNSDGS